MALLDGVNAPTIKVEFDIGNSGTFVLGVSLLGGVDKLGTPVTPNWVQVPSYDIRAISTRRGRSLENQANQPGTLTLIVDNHSGTYDPANTSSTWTWAGQTLLTRGLGIRLSATWNSVQYFIYRGYCEQVQPDAGMDATVTFTFTDALAFLGQANLTTIASSYSGDTTSVRLGRILDAIGWSASLRSLTGSRQMGATTYGNTALQLADQIENCEYGRLYADNLGNIKLLPFESLLSTTYRFSLSDSQVSGQVEYDTIVTNPGTKYLVNSVTINQTTSTSQTATNASSILRYGTFQLAVDAPILNNSDALTLAQIYANKNALPITRVDHIEYDALGIGTLWGSMLSTDLGDNVNVNRTTVDGRVQFFTSLVESINFDITPDNWRVAMDLSPSARVGLFVLDSSKLDGTDTLWY